MNPFLVEIKNLNFSYDPHSPHLILKDINLQVAANEFWGILGPNGAGKSTLIKLILGLLKPQSGHIRVCGLPPRHAIKQTGYVPQFASFQKNFPITVFDTVLMGRLSSAPFFGFYSIEDQNKTQQVLEELKLDGLSHLSLSELSGGQLQRVLIARALVGEPRILILDEPTSNVDTHAEEDFFILLKKLQKKMSVLVVSHDFGFISQYVDHIACVNQTLYTEKIESLSAEKLESMYGDGSFKMISHHHHSQSHTHKPGTSQK